MSRLHDIMRKGAPHSTVIHAICGWMTKNKTINFSMFSAMTDEISKDDWRKVLRALTRYGYTKPIGKATNKQTGKQSTLYNGSNLRFEYENWAQKK